MAQCKAIRMSTLALFVLAATCVFGCSYSEPSPLNAAGVRRITPRGRKWSPVGGISWSPNGTQLALAWTIGGLVDEPEGYVYTIDVKDPEPRIVIHTQAAAGFTSLAWSPTSDQVAVSTNAWNPPGIWLVDLAGGQEPTRLGQGTSCAWAPDGERIAIARGAEESFSIYVLNPRTGEQREVFQVSEEDQYAIGGGISWSLIGDRLAFSFGFDDHDPSTQDIMGLYELDLTSSESRLLSEGDWIWSPSWSPDGTMIVYSSAQHVYEDTLTVMRVDDGSIVRPLNVNGISLTAWSPDGSLIAFEWNGGVYTIDTVTALREWFPVED